LIALINPLHSKEATVRWLKEKREKLPPNGDVTENIFVSEKLRNVRKTEKFHVKNSDKDRNCDVERFVQSVGELESKCADAKSQRKLDKIRNGRNSPSVYSWNHPTLIFDY
jgi:hypothetical protein